MSEQLKEKMENFDKDLSEIQKRHARHVRDQNVRNRNAQNQNVKNVSRINTGKSDGENVKVYKPTEKRYGSSSAKILNLILAVISIVVGIVILVNISLVLVAICVVMQYLIIGGILFSMIATLIFLAIGLFRYCGSW